MKCTGNGYVQHSSPVTSTGLSKLRELLEIVFAEDGVNSQLSAEGGEVGAVGIPDELEEN